jgi:glucose/arabinose dehydrogenase
MSKRSRIIALLAAVASALVVAMLPGAAAAAPPELVSVGEFDNPIFVAGAPGDDRRLFVVEREGQIRLVRDGETLANPFLEIPGGVDTSGERGLLSMAFPPDYPDTRRFYVFYTKPSGGNVRIDEFRRKSSTKNRAQPASQRRVLSIDHNATNHVGGQLQFDSNGRLYVSIGEAGNPDNAQDLSSPLGKLLRIRPEGPGSGDYSVPSSNPFVGDGEALAEIFAYGLRNPFRFSFDRKLGTLLLADVGQNEWEEIDAGAPGSLAGANFGWDCFEGFEPFDGGASCLEPPGAEHEPPVFTYGHDGGRCSITGGYVVRDASLDTLKGRYVYGDHCTGEIVTLGPGTGGPEEGPTGLSVNGFSLSSFGEDTAGCVYVTTLSEDEVFRIAPEGDSDPGPCEL